ncbi:hypothetical protein OIE62_17970 [Streptomyces scopuliridis]|uniref:Uncharacterized protein n=1 Tax=Streptomyces scopuliridis TaxID=452529 RepID=A0ACD4ZN36_9ACTN|nr:hypothetical protein [Streptomyces scopuliridis]WSB99585.1 hypothetical protein OG835_22990 [Streptomyces scopuliridis]WSC06717.1 hypothetical protein OIE62_17970 [Streptomyces scopuliridis]
MSRSFSHDPSLPPLPPLPHPSPVPSALTSPFPSPLPSPAAPEPCGVPPFGPLRVRGSGRRLRRALFRRRRTTAAGLAMTAAALAAAGAGCSVGTAADADARAESTAPGAVAVPPPSRPPRAQRATEMVSAPVRIADAATVRLLRRGDRVDVIAAAEGAPEARVVASGARVTEVPKAPESIGDGWDGGALIVLSVPRAIATELAGAGATSRLAVTLC